MDIVYICRDGENEELRYSIRSAVKNLPHDNLWVVGGKPSWYTGNHIPVQQNKTKYENARNNMKIIAETEEISKDFILMNDDFFIMKPVKRMGTYHAGNISARINSLKKKYGRSSYMNLLISTVRYLRKHSIIHVLDYTLHVPFKMNRDKLLPILNETVSWRVAYGNLYKIGGREVKVRSGETKDVKVYVHKGELVGVGKNTISETYWSSQDESFPTILPILQEAFPDPSPYEKGYIQEGHGSE